MLWVVYEVTYVSIAGNVEIWRKQLQTFSYKLHSYIKNDGYDKNNSQWGHYICLLYTSDAADD